MLKSLKCFASQSFGVLLRATAFFDFKLALPSGKSRQEWHNTTASKFDHPNWEQIGASKW
eukprot:4555565-Amphidinium_carterae.1